MKSPMVLAGETRRGGNGLFQRFFHGARVILEDGEDDWVVDDGGGFGHPTAVEVVASCRI